MTIPDPKDDAMAARRCAVAHPNDGSPGYTARRGLDFPRGSRVSQLGLDRRIGGRMGRHAWPRGVFFDPGPWAIMSAIVIWCKNPSPDVNTFVPAVKMIIYHLLIF